MLMMMNIEKRRILCIALLVVALTFERHGKTRVLQVYGQEEFVEEEEEEEKGISISSRSNRGGGGEDFVKVSGLQFTRNGSTFYLNGFNAYWMMVVASDPTQRLKVASALRQASVYGLTLARTWAFSDGTAASNKPLQSAPGSYNEAMFQGLDFVVSEAHRNGIYLIMTLVNYYSDFGGRKQYVQWAREKGQNVTSTDDFYTNIMIKGFYKNHVKTILTRRNTINGMIYKDDPTIFAWELINEPRCESDLSGKTLQNWITEMAAYVKSIDKKHLLDVGMEGFYGNSAPEKKHLNPGGAVFGTDFLIHNQIKGIDFATFHAYPDIWLSGSVDKVQLEYMKNWTESHVQDAGRILKMPILVGEFGKSLKPKGGSIKSRDALMVITYTMILHSARNNGPFAGGLFWQLLNQALGQFQDGYGIVLPEFPSTAALIASHSRTLSNLNHHL